MSTESKVQTRAAMFKTISDATNELNEIQEQIELFSNRMVADEPSAAAMWAIVERLAKAFNEPLQQLEETLTKLEHIEGEMQP